MNKCLTILAGYLLFGISVCAQLPAHTKIKEPRFHHVITAGPAIPLAGFSNTHFGGITTSYIRNMMKDHHSAVFKRKKTGWLTVASLSHYLGKNENNGLVSYRYKGYSVLELNAGAAWYPANKLDLSLRAGPALGIYNKIFRFTLTSTLQGSYKRGPKTVITPGLTLLKETGNDAVWVTSLQLGLVF